VHRIHRSDTQVGGDPRLSFMDIVPMSAASPGSEVAITIESMFFHEQATATTSDDACPSFA